MKRTNLIYLLFFCILSLLVGEENKRPKEGVRYIETDLSASYFAPLLLNWNQGDDTFAYYNGFSFRGSIYNLIKEGPNLHLFYSVDHSIGPKVVIPEERGEIMEYELKNQSTNVVSVQALFSPGYFFNISLTGDYWQNRIIHEDVSYKDYSFNKMDTGLELLWDSRYSSLESWYRGTIFKYPQEGFLLGLGGNLLWGEETLLKNQYQKGYLNARAEYIQPLFPYWGLFFGVRGKSFLQSYEQRAIALESEVIGAYPLMGDYNADGRIEMRFFYPGGLFVKTPRWGVASFLLKFSPGFLVGYNGGITGRFEQGASIFQQSVYATPVIAMRFQGNLMLVARFDFSFSSSQEFNGVFSVNFGFFNSEIAPLAQIGLER